LSRSAAHGPPPRSHQEADPIISNPSPRPQPPRSATCARGHERAKGALDLGQPERVPRPEQPDRLDARARQQRAVGELTK